MSAYEEYAEEFVAEESEDEGLESGAPEAETLEAGEDDSEIDDDIED
ncbi:MAG: hypothetical protein AAF728_13650 [Cyanobacteria bacterium P01_D01_bin.128]